MYKIYKYTKRAPSVVEALAVFVGVSMHLSLLYHYFLIFKRGKINVFLKEQNN